MSIQRMVTVGVAMISLLPWLMHADDKESWIMQPASGRMSEMTITTMVPVPPDNALKEKLGVIQKKWIAGKPKNGTPETLDESRQHLWKNVNMVCPPAFCIEWNEVFYFSGGQSTWRETDFTSGYAIRKGKGTIYSWHGIDWDEEFPKGPQPAKVVARLGRAVFQNKQFPGYFQNSQPTNEPVALGAADCLRFMDWVLERQKAKALKDWGIAPVGHSWVAQEWKRVEALPPEKLARYTEAMRMIKLKPERVDLIDESVLKGNRVEGWPWVGDMNVIDASIPAADNCWLKGPRKEDWAWVWEMNGIDADALDADDELPRFDLVALRYMRPQIERLLLARTLREKVVGGSAGTPAAAWQKWELWCLGQVKSAEIVFEDAAFQKEYEAHLETVEKSTQKRAAQKKPFWRFGGN